MKPDKSSGSQRKRSYGDKTKNIAFPTFSIFAHTGHNLGRFRTTGASQWVAKIENAGNVIFFCLDTV